MSRGMILIPKEKYDMLRLKDLTAGTKQIGQNMYHQPVVWPQGQQRIEDSGDVPVHKTI